MKYIILLYCFVLLSPLNLLAQEDSPFTWSVDVADGDVQVVASVPNNHYLYSVSTSVKLLGEDGRELEALHTPATIEHEDAIFGKTAIYAGGVSHLWVFALPDNGKYRIKIAFQGCRDADTSGNPAVCFPPGDKEFTIGAMGLVHDKFSVKTNLDAAVSSDTSELGIVQILDRFSVVSETSGYITSDKFLTFLDQKDSSNTSGNFLTGKGIWLVIVLVVIGGLGLNLTPCVLPMIPVNLAIIGAGVNAQSKWSGLFRGAVYGAGIALAYGALGVAAVLMGARFGALNSTAWFNFAIAAVFIVLSLAMFDIFAIDLSRFSTKIGPKGSDGGKLVPVFLLGVVSALLAGACVAPVVIAVLLHSSSLYSGGSYIGLLLPFILGFGMALPWPFAGAGISVMPKPGRWMVRIKQLFGVLIFIFACYYGYTGYTLLPDSKSGALAKSSLSALKEALQRSLKEEKPVFIDFWASWCKNCKQMELTTFKDERVIKKLHEDYIEVKFQAEKMDAADTKVILDYFEVKGLPSYIVLRPKK